MEACEMLDRLDYLVNGGPARCEANPATGGCHCNMCLVKVSDERCLGCYPDDESVHRELIRRRIIAEEMHGY